MRLNLRWMTILTLVGLFLACAWGSVLFSQNLLGGFDTEEAELAGGRVAEVDDDDDDDDASAAERDDDDDDAGDAEAADGITGSISVSPGTDNPESLAEISAAEAEEIALDEAPEAQLEELDLEVENGYLVYEVELTNGMEIIIDAGNGYVLQTKAND